MAKHVLRWGQSAYERDVDLGFERDGIQELGMSWATAPESPQAPSLDGVDALVVTSRVRVSAEVLDRFSGSLVLTTTSGTDHIDLAAAEARGVAVGRCPLARRDAVVEHALGSLLGLMRRQPALHRAAREGTWARKALPELGPTLLRGAPVLVVGLGVIGTRMAEVLEHLGAQVHGFDPQGLPARVRGVELDEALPQMAAVTIHCALTPSSRGLMSEERIGRLAPHTVLVNTARGPIVDVPAAVEAVRNGRLRGLSLDVFPTEPWPGLGAAAEVDGVWLSPHSSGYAEGLGERVAAEVVSTLGAWAKGAPLPHPVRSGAV